ncbi:hypothetical protein LPJ66_002833 [Kickxella alabastrina]|uniref:Uncharacterized protein n=1 Tax=Kickxella alabastrina TaxID=61397 RepID=A0ACC1IPD6_9FUNG|nr:hypothetical protein LPJ66_002833 [Kickxella alabastrina]
MFARQGGRRVLGMKGGLRIEAGDGPEIVLAKKGERQAQRYMDIDWNGARYEPEMIKPESGASDENLMALAGFVPLVDGLTGSKQPSADNKYDSDGNGERDSTKRPDFRSMAGMAKPAASADEQRPRTLEFNEFANGASQVKLRECEQRIKANVRDEDAWLALVALQEDIALSSFSESSRHKAKRTVAETKIEVYRRALESNPQSVQLVLGYLDQCKELMNDDEIMAEWDRAVDRASNEPDIIMHYVRACQTTASRFSVAKATEVYAAAIKRVMRMLRGRMGDVPRRLELSVLIFDLIHGACLMFREAGYFERAVAVYQAVVEWYLLTPSQLWLAPFSHRLSAFESFWDSGVSRIGSESARGWVNYHSGDMALAAPANMDEGLSHNVAKCSDSSLDAWCAADKQCSNMSSTCIPLLVPMALLDESMISELDPFSVTIFEDVEPFLVDIPWHGAATRPLIDRFMQFLGIVGPQSFVFSKSGLTTSDIPWTSVGCGGDVFTAAQGLAMWPSSGSDSGPPDDLNSTHGQRFPFVSVPTTADTVDISLPYTYACMWLRPTNALYGDMFEHAVTLFLQPSATQQRLDLHMQKMLGVVLLEWSFSVSAARGKQLGKQLLSRQPASLALWNAFAKMHARYGFWDEARKIWAATLASEFSIPESERSWLIVVCKSWALMEAKHGRGLAMCVKVLGCSTAAEYQSLAEPQAIQDSSANSFAGLAKDDDQCSVLPEDILRAKAAVAAVKSGAGCGTPADEIRHAVLAIDLWLMYAVKRDCSAANTVYTDFIATTRSLPLAQLPRVADADGHAPAGSNIELATMEICSIHLFHALSFKVHRAADLRNRLQEALDQFPHNTMFWEMFIASEARTKIVNRVHRKVNSAADQHRTPDLYMMAVYSELKQMTNVNSARWALRKATRNGECASVLAWAIYVTYECRQNSIKRAKRVLLAALRMCPWAKPLYVLALDASGPLAAAFTSEEKMALIRAMVTAGLRFYADCSCI